jgi:hypothetical protein
VFFLSMIVRFIRVIKLWNFFRMKEMDMHVNIRLIALLKFFIMVFGLSHWVGCGWYFSARLAKFSDGENDVSWAGAYTRPLHSST